MTKAKASLFRTPMVLAAAALAASLLISFAAGTSLQAVQGSKARIAFASNRAGNGMDIWVMNADGTNQVRLTNDPIREDFPAFSPDGGRIAFERFEFDDQGHVLGTGEIYVIGADGEGLTNLTNTPGSDDIRPDWAPESW